MYSDGDFFDIFLIERCFFGSLVQTQSRHRANIIDLMQDFCKISRFLINGIIIYRFTFETIRKSIINVGCSSWIEQRNLKTVFFHDEKRWFESYYHHGNTKSMMDNPMNIVVFNEMLWIETVSMKSFFARCELQRSLNIMSYFHYV